VKKTVKICFIPFVPWITSSFLVSESDEHKAIDGSLQNLVVPVYSGWAIWDNYREQLPMLSFGVRYFAPIVKSVLICIRMGGRRTGQQSWIGTYS
jgi:hypothetical protein